MRTPRSQMRQVSSSSSLRLSHAGSGAGSTAFIVSEIRDSALKPLFHGVAKAVKIDTIAELSRRMDDPNYADARLPRSCFVRALWHRPPARNWTKSSLQ